MAGTQIKKTFLSQQSTGEGLERHSKYSNNIPALIQTTRKLHYMALRRLAQIFM